MGAGGAAGLLFGVSKKAAKRGVGALFGLPAIGAAIWIHVRISIRRQRPRFSKF